ncbi:hypothetical protein AB9P05_21695 [Roseivirga sp. BDSF3-8]|uniref:hypothetical protein n=1 Tax=Roseivirga sp. BDSF3-8 TaxID=3241598 RepID=UPI003532490E
MKPFLPALGLSLLLIPFNARSQSCGSNMVEARYAGSLVTLTRYTGVDHPSEALGSPDYNLLFNPGQARFREDDVAVYDLRKHIPAGEIIKIHLIVSVGDRMQIAASPDNFRYKGEKVLYNDLALISTSLTFDYTVPAGGVRYIWFKSIAGTILLDGVTYDFTACLPDADSDGVADESYHDNDHEALKGRSLRQWYNLNETGPPEQNYPYRAIARKVR